MNCPNCKTEMEDEDFLVDSTGMDRQEFPDMHWCPKCGIFISRHWRNGRRISIPKDCAIVNPEIEKYKNHSNKV